MCALAVGNGEGEREKTESDPVFPLHNTSHTKRDVHLDPTQDPLTPSASSHRRPRGRRRTRPRLAAAAAARQGRQRLRRQHPAVRAVAPAATQRGTTAGAGGRGPVVADPHGRLAPGVLVVVRVEVGTEEAAAELLFCVCGCGG